MCFRWGLRCFPRGRQATDQACIGTLGWSSSGQPVGNSCTSRGRYGRSTHQPEDAPYGEIAPDLQYHPPLSDGHRAPERDLKSLASFGVYCCGTLQLGAQGITAQAKINAKFGCCSCTYTRDCACAPTQSSGFQVSASENTSGRPSHK